MNCEKAPTGKPRNMQESRVKTVVGCSIIRK